MGLEKKARDRIRNYFEEHSSMSKDELIECIWPHYSFDISKMKRQELGRVANRVMASCRNKKGTRKAFNLKSDTESTYINTEKTDEPEILERVAKSLRKKRFGLDASIKHITNRVNDLGGQISFDEFMRDDSNDEGTA